MIVGGLCDEMDAQIRTDKTGAASDNNCLLHGTERNEMERNGTERNGTEENVITYINYYLNSV